MRCYHLKNIRILKKKILLSFVPTGMIKRQMQTNIKSLSLGLESMVFLDDNPVERAQVRMELKPVPELPNDPSLYSKTLINAGYFETISFSKDKKRVKSYEANSKDLSFLKQVQH